MGAFTPRQHKALVERLARAVLWHRAAAHERDNARSMALAIVRELDESPAADRAVRRGIEVVIDDLEKTA